MTAGTFLPGARHQPVRVLEKVDGPLCRVLQPTALRVPFTLSFQKRLTAEASPGPNSRHPHPISTQKVPRMNSTAVQEPRPRLPLLTFPHKSPPVPKHVPEKHKACHRATVSSGRTQRISRKPPCVNPMPRRIMTTSKRQPCAPARLPVETAHAGGHARVHTGPGPAPWRPGRP